jgi:hypothetical protein
MAFDLDDDQEEIIVSQGNPSPSTVELDALVEVTVTAPGEL